MLKKQFYIFLNAQMFYTRIPIAKWMYSGSFPHDEAMLNKATIYFPVIGWIVGAIAAGVFYGASYIFTPEIAILLSMVASILTTGAFHEDGFADVCDGFGGGWTKLKILDIMKDSRVGTYGAVGIVLLLALKFFCLKSFDNQLLMWALMIAHPLSRFTALSFIFTHEYVREDALSKAKPIAKKLPFTDLLIAFCFSIVPLIAYLWYAQNYQLLIVAVPLVITKAWLAKYFTKWIGGYTGDCLGATQQITEVIIYLTFMALLKN